MGVGFFVCVFVLVCVCVCVCYYSSMKLKYREYDITLPTHMSNSLPYTRNATLALFPFNLMCSRVYVTLYVWVLMWMCVRARVTAAVWNKSIAK